ncbi:MAG: tRNA dihydrouridine synthase [Spirochaetota bacterium]
MDTLWSRLPRPIHALAPMEDVTDTVFRRIVARCGRPDVFFTEFIHTNIVLARRRRRPGVTPRLVYVSEERPLIAQIWGNDPVGYERAAARLVAMGFDGVDINMGCPVRKIRARGACSGLILQPSLAAELIAAAREGIERGRRELATSAHDTGNDRDTAAGDGAGGAAARFPLSVKTRIGYSAPQTEEWIGHLLSCDLDALTIHGRYAEQESEGEADWNEIGRAAALARQMGVSTAILGNGDVSSRTEIREKSERYGLDGVMVGRGIFSDPYLFAAPGRAVAFADAEPAEKINLLLDHVRLYREVWGETRNYEILKKFYKIYLSGFPGAQTLRDRLNLTHDFDSAERVVQAWVASRR